MYLIFAVINHLAFPPITRTKYSDQFIPERKTDRENPATYLAKAVIPLFLITVSYVFSDNTPRVPKSVLCVSK